MWHSETFANSKIIHRVKYTCISAGNLWNIVWLHLIASLRSGSNRLSNRPHVNYEARSYEAEASPCEIKPEAAKISIHTSFKKRSGLKTSDAGAGFQVTPTYPTVSSFPTSPIFAFKVLLYGTNSYFLTGLQSQKIRKKIEINDKICTFFLPNTDMPSLVDLGQF